MDTLQYNPQWEIHVAVARDDEIAFDEQLVKQEQPQWVEKRNEVLYHMSVNCDSLHQIGPRYSSNTAGDGPEQTRCGKFWFPRFKSKELGDFRSATMFICCQCAVKDGKTSGRTKVSEYKHCQCGRDQWQLAKDVEMQERKRRTEVIRKFNGVRYEEAAQLLKLSAPGSSIGSSTPSQYVPTPPSQYYSMPQPSLHGYNPDVKQAWLGRRSPPPFHPSPSASQVPSASEEQVEDKVAPLKRRRSRSSSDIENQSDGDDQQKRLTSTMKQNDSKRNKSSNGQLTETGDSTKAAPSLKCNTTVGKLDSPPAIIPTSPPELQNPPTLSAPATTSNDQPIRVVLPSLTLHSSNLNGLVPPRPMQTQTQMRHPNITSPQGSSYPLSMSARLPVPSSSGSDASTSASGPTMSGYQFLKLQFLYEQRSLDATADRRRHRLALLNQLREMIGTIAQLYRYHSECKINGSSQELIVEITQDLAFLRSEKHKLMQELNDLDRQT